MRYRITVEVDTPEGLRTGSSVWEVSASEGIGFPGPEAGSISYKIKGDAVAVDLPGTTVFALLRSTNGSVDYPAYVVQRHLFAYPEPRIELIMDNWRESLRRIRASKVQFDLANDEYPMLVRFRDLHDPGTVERLDGDGIHERLGIGFHIARIAIQITDDPVELKINKRFSWWNDYIDRHFDGTSAIVEDMKSKDLSSHLTSRSFSTEVGR